MYITVIHGQMHHGSTYEITKQIINRVAFEQTKVTEFFLPKDMPYPCVGCYSCFEKGEDACPHYHAVKPIVEALEESDIIVLESPCYVGGMTGQMKILLDHLAFRWMSHRPHENMFKKVGIVISTAAGAGAKKTTKALKENLFFWGIPVVHSMAVNVAAASWAEVSDERKKRIALELAKLSNRVIRDVKNPRVGIKMRALYKIMQMNQKSNTWNPTDKRHWEDKGWLSKKRPFE